MTRDQMTARIAKLRAEIKDFNHRYMCLGWGSGLRLHHETLTREREIRRLEDALRDIDATEGDQNTIKKPTTASDGLKVLAGSIERLEREITS